MSHSLIAGLNRSEKSTVSIVPGHYEWRVAGTHVLAKKFTQGAAFQLCSRGMWLFATDYGWLRRHRILEVVTSLLGSLRDRTAQYASPQGGRESAPALLLSVPTGKPREDFKTFHFFQYLHKSFVHRDKSIPKEASDSFVLLQPRL